MTELLSILIEVSGNLSLRKNTTLSVGGWWASACSRTAGSHL